MLTPDTLRSCVADLGAKGAETAYGMTEGVLIRPFTQRNLSELVAGDEVTVGWAMPGARLKIADPETNQPVPRNTFGELHGSGLLVAPYIGDGGNDAFYNDEGGQLWIKTGDQARMDDQDRIFITGRYKEM
jgi:fatty-acyl-CoA synthase